MTPGILDRTPRLSPVQRISPSRYEALRQCALREAWAAAGEPPLLPLPPAARLGTAIHQLLEEAGKGKLMPGEGGKIERRWDELVTEAETKMRSTWLEAQFVPLRSSVPDFEVRRIRALSRALTIAQAVAACRKEPGKKPAPGFERWVESQDGSVGGYIDHILETPDGPTLRDYKSGTIYEGVASTGAVKESFAAQLRLYAALFAATTGTWPARLELVPLQGEAVCIPFAPAVCDDLLADATAALRRVNAAITEFASNPAEAEKRLASPGTAICGRCAFRPGCAAYRLARVAATETEAWPEDLRGELHEIRKLGNGKLFLVLVADAGEASVRHIRGISPDTRRHPALAHLHSGDKIALFNLRRVAAGCTFGESPWTVIYKIAQMEEGQS